MLEARGNLWTYPADYRCITTNGTVKRNGAAVMGRGCAAEARDRYPGLDQQLGASLRRVGNHVVQLLPRAAQHQGLFTFPVKHHWFEQADLELIARSASELAAFVSGMPWHQTLVLPRPGCGNGGRTWAEVEPLLKALPDRVTVITF